METFMHPTPFVFTVYGTTEWVYNVMAPSCGEMGCWQRVNDFFIQDHIQFCVLWWVIML